MEQIDLQPFVSERDNVFQITFAAAPIGMVLMDQDGHFLMANPALLEMLGYTEAEFLALTVADITHPDDIAATHSLIELLYAGGLPGDRYQQEKRYLHKHGSVMWGMLSVALVRDANGNPICSMGQLINTTESKRNEMLQRSYAGIGTAGNRGGP
jgi:PAS domain S-box-containing protein